MAERPDGWDGKDWSKVKRVDLSGRNLAFADAAQAFLVNADLAHANLQGANLDQAQLQGAHLAEARLQGAFLIETNLQRADLRGAEFRGADLTEAQLQGAYVTAGQFQGANLRGTQLQGAFLVKAQFQGASLVEAQLEGAGLVAVQLQGADLSGAQLQGAGLMDVQLQGANLSGAQLQGADLMDVQLQGADLRKTALWRVRLDGARWDYGDLRGAHAQPMSNSDIDALIAEATKGVPDMEGPDGRMEVAERLNVALRTGKLRPGPEFPEEWRWEPNVIFDQNDPEPKPFECGPPRWATEQAYDVELAKSLGELACVPNVPEAQTGGLARRALEATMEPMNGREHMVGRLLGLERPSDDPDRLWRRLFAARVIGPDCPPAKGLPDDMRHQLEQLAAQGDAAVASPQASPADSAE